MFIVAAFGGRYDDRLSVAEIYEITIAGRLKSDGDDLTWRSSAARRFRQLSGAEVVERHNAVLARILKRRGGNISRLLRELRKRMPHLPAECWAADAVAKATKAA